MCYAGFFLTNMDTIKPTPPSSFNPLGPDADNDGILDADDPDAPTAPPEFAEKADLTDTDADGLPDAWETAHGFDPNDAADAASDQDRDGLTALDGVG